MGPYCSTVPTVLRVQFAKPYQRDSGLHRRRSASWNAGPDMRTGGILLLQVAEPMA